MTAEEAGERVMTGCGDSALCPSNVSCEACGEVAYCLDDPPAWHPCPHDRALCGRPDCLAECPDCREAMWADAVATGTYSPAGDPLTTRPVETDAEYAERVRLPGFDTSTNTYNRRERHQ